MLCSCVKLLQHPNEEVTLRNDVSEFGLGSVLLQRNKPVAYASRLLSPAEARYAQIEKEMLAVLEKFRSYTYGRDVKVVTDQKLQEAIKLTSLSKAPRRLQHMLLREQLYHYQIFYKP